MNIPDVFFKSVELEASDIFISSGKVPVLRRNGGLVRLEGAQATSADELNGFRNSLLDEAKKLDYAKSSGADATFIHENRRFRVNFFETVNGPALAARPVKLGKDCTFERYNIPVEIFNKLADLQRGLVLFTGSTGCGKSTTMSSLINAINHRRSCHILTLEDPVEFIHEDACSLISQRETGSISGGFLGALRDAMRENPDVIVIGEMRDPDTVSSAIGAALTGHLVLATMHTLDTATTVERIINMYPEDRRDQIAGSVALALEAVVSQRLIPAASGGGMVPAFEVLLGTEVVRKNISRQDFGELERCLRAYAHLGMCAFNDSLYDLFRRNRITFEAAEEFSDNKDELRLMRSGISSGNAGGRGSVYSKTALGTGEVDMHDLFRAAVRAGASDLLLTAGVAPQLRVAGAFVPLELPALDANDTLHLVHSLLSRTQRIRLEEQRNLDLAMTVRLRAKSGQSGFEERRFRINAFFQRGALALVARLLSETIPVPEELGLPPVLLESMQKKQGLILITGPTGSGKSTTLASMIDHINNFSGRHIVTIEDPIEYIHRNRQCIIEQRELGDDTLSFSDGLRAAMRQAPDIIMVGEMRDRETISAALTAAETGHLVLATLHSNNAMQTIERIIDTFPEGQQNQIRQQFAATVLVVASQRLIPRLDDPGRRIAAFEVMVGTYAVRALIRDKKTHQLASVMESSFRDGMVTMQRSLSDLAEMGLIDENDARNFDTGT
ncbi:MAG: PilT/PilU family type 4a pilus ATPase [Lentisphaeria bacterium]|nr:PilT/PilU family type 4a pilus ATPase [Lentisphaeria bacterium]